MVSSSAVDKEFFETHPNQRSYRRKVIRGELPSSLRRLRVVIVHVSLLQEDVFWKLFIGVNGSAVGQVLSINDEKISTAARRRMARFCRAMFDAFLSGSD
jgi:hypothetical protein